MTTFSTAACIFFCVCVRVFVCVCVVLRARRVQRFRLPKEVRTRARAAGQSECVDAVAGAAAMQEQLQINAKLRYGVAGTMLAMLLV